MKTIGFTKEFNSSMTQGGDVNGYSIVLSDNEFTGETMYMVDMILEFASDNSSDAVVSVNIAASDQSDPPSDDVDWRRVTDGRRGQNTGGDVDYRFTTNYIAMGEFGDVDSNTVFINIDVQCYNGGSEFRFIRATGIVKHFGRTAQ